MFNSTGVLRKSPAGLSLEWVNPHHINLSELCVGAITEILEMLLSF